jgi:hypothetical protein
MGWKMKKKPILSLPELPTEEKKTSYLSPALQPKEVLSILWNRYVVKLLRRKVCLMYAMLNLKSNIGWKSLFEYYQNSHGMKRSRQLLKRLSSDI